MAHDNSIILASNNPGKLTEFSALLHPLHYRIIPQSEASVSEVEETGYTFLENALIKARHASEQTGLPALADDSGLVVPALHGTPGIYSARYAGRNASAHDNIQKLLSNMATLQDQDRHAWFYCVLIFIRHAQDPCPIVAQGRWDGTILHAPKGEQGFGYDPVFFDPTLNQAAAELPLSVKNKISHRGKALQSLITQLSCAL